VGKALLKKVTRRARGLEVAKSQKKGKDRKNIRTGTRRPEIVNEKTRGD